MLKWCSYCQRFQGEAPPFDDLRMTHGLCADCIPLAPTFNDRDVESVRTLQKLHDALLDVGRQGNVRAADRIIDQAVAAGCRSVDILLGIVAPLLYQIGDEWARGVTTVEQEHQFTALCEALYDRVAERSAVGDNPPDASTPPEVLLLNAPGNEHTLAIRMLALWLRHENHRADVIDAAVAVNDLPGLVRRKHPRLVMISMALPDQLSAVETLVERLVSTSRPDGPRVLVGGYAVKSGLVASIPGAEMVTDLVVLRAGALLPGQRV
ncbi:MAG: cobalamin B12-binding domain-containing protein [Acidobacteria bacterium]|nr:cobalamin B12-binding domain-containing protein [Acidobacteriota bacterium]